MFSGANLRIFLWALLAMAFLTNYTLWQSEHAPVAVPAGVSPTASLGDISATLPSAPSTTAGSGSAPTPAVSVPDQTAPVATTPAAAAAVPTAGSVRVVTDVLDMTVGLAGGELRQADLLQYHDRKGETKPVRLLNRDSATSLYVLQSGLLATDGGAAPTHLAMFSSNVSEVRLAGGQDSVQLPLTWTNDAGVTVTKTYTFKRGSYQIGLDYRIDNAGTTPWGFASYAQLLRNNVPIERSYFKPDSISFKGPAYFDGTKYQKLQLAKKDARLDQSITGGWIAALQNHFVSAVIPKPGAVYHYQLRQQGDQFLLNATGAPQEVAAGASATQTETLFVGPKLQSQLNAAGTDLFRVADYGSLTFIAQPLFQLVNFAHSLVGNWGLAIMLATLILKLIFYWPSEIAGRSMGKMKTLGPRIKVLQETYKDDREKLAKATMELYKKEKVNPAAGCLPMLIQLPVFLAFYWVLFESVEMRQAPFMGWIQDLSSRDPFFILPVLMATANFIQFKLNPNMTADPVQQKIFMLMPIVMSATLAFFPAGLVLYWVTNTVLGILQQWNINRRINEQTLKARA
jgi:YidC/Oxa1 family membrane protein insertase